MIRSSAINGTRLLNSQERIRMYLYALLQIVMNLIDILSVALLGIFISYGLAKMSSGPMGTTSSQLLAFLPEGLTSKLTYQVTGISAILLMTFKSLAASSLSKYSFRNLEKCAIRTANTLLEDVGERPENYLKRFSIDDIIFALKTGIDAVVIVGLSSIVIFVTEGFLIFAMFIFLLIFQGFIAILIVIFILFLLFFLQKLVIPTISIITPFGLFKIYFFT